MTHETTNPAAPSVLAWFVVAPLCVHLLLAAAAVAGVYVSGLSYPANIIVAAIVGSAVWVALLVMLPGLLILYATLCIQWRRNPNRAKAQMFRIGCCIPVPAMAVVVAGLSAQFF